jgi:hypothetical protein
VLLDGERIVRRGEEQVNENFCASFWKIVENIFGAKKNSGAIYCATTKLWADSWACDEGVRAKKEGTMNRAPTVECGAWIILLWLRGR